jgi:hypothetical protein
MSQLISELDDLFLSNYNNYNDIFYKINDDRLHKVKTLYSLKIMYFKNKKDDQNSNYDYIIVSYSSNIKLTRFSFPKDENTYVSINNPRPNRISLVLILEDNFRIKISIFRLVYLKINILRFGIETANMFIMCWEGIKLLNYFKSTSSAAEHLIDMYCQI